MMAQLSEFLEEDELAVLMDSPDAHANWTQRRMNSNPEFVKVRIHPSHIPEITKRRLFTYCGREYDPVLAVKVIDDIYNANYNDPISKRVAIIKKIDLDIIISEKERYTPFHLAAACGRLEICRKLVICGASPEKEDCHGMAPFHYAVRNGRIEVVSYLISTRPSLVHLRTDSDFGESPLTLALNNSLEFESCQQLVDLLLAHGAAPSLQTVILGIHCFMTRNFIGDEEQVNDYLHKILAPIVTTYEAISNIERDYHYKLLLTIGRANPTDREPPRPIHIAKKRLLLRWLLQRGLILPARYVMKDVHTLHYRQPDDARYAEYDPGSLDTISITLLKERAMTLVSAFEFHLSQRQMASLLMADLQFMYYWHRNAFQWSAGIPLEKRTFMTLWHLPTPQKIDADHKLCYESD